MPFADARMTPLIYIAARIESRKSRLPTIPLADRGDFMHDHSAASTRIPFPIATMLTPNERLRVDAAGDGSYRAIHRDSVAEVVQDLKSNRAGAVLVSVARYDQHARAG